MTPKSEEGKESILMSAALPIFMYPIDLLSISTLAIKLLAGTILSTGSLVWATNPALFGFKSNTVPDIGALIS